MAGNFPDGVATKVITFGRYSTAAGSARGGTATVGFADPMLHLPTGEVIVSGDETVTIESLSGSLAIVVPVTVDPNLVANWATASPYRNQRIRVSVDIDGYPSGVRYLEISPDDPNVMDYDTLQQFDVQDGLPVARAAVTSVGGLGGDVSAVDLRSILGIPSEAGEGLVLTAPNGSRYIVSVDNSGTLRTTPAA